MHFSIQTAWFDTCRAAKGPPGARRTFKILGMPAWQKSLQQLRSRKRPILSPRDNYESKIRCFNYTYGTLFDHKLLFMSSNMLRAASNENYMYFTNPPLSSAEAPAWCPNKNSNNRKIHFPLPSLPTTESQAGESVN